MEANEKSARGAVTVSKDRSQLKPKKRKRIVLEDDEYVERLGRVIRRDFYPDLHKAYEAGIIKDFESDKFKYQESYNTDPVGVDKFHSLFTSEDNESFEVLHNKDKEDHKQKYWWAFQNDITDKRLLEDESRMVLLKDRKSSKKLLKDKYTAEGRKLNHKATRFFPMGPPDARSEASSVTARTEQALPVVNGYTFVTTSTVSTENHLSSAKCEFSISGRSKREETAHALARKIESSQRRNKRAEMNRQKRNTPSFTANSRNTKLTPAALSLAKRLGSVQK